MKRQLRRTLSSLGLLVLLVVSGAFVFIAFPVALAPVTKASTPLNQDGFYRVSTLHGVPNSIEIFEPDYTIEIANGSAFSYSLQPYSLNFTRNPTVDVADGAIGGEAPFWTEAIGCGCGDDQGTGGPNVRVWHVLYADSRVLVLQYNNTYPGVQPQDNYTMVFYKGTDWFVWQIDQEVVSGRPSAYNTAWDGYDQAVSWNIGSTYLHACLTSSGGFQTGGTSSSCGGRVSKTWDIENREVEFAGATIGGLSGYDNASIYEYALSSNVPYWSIGAANNGEQKASTIPCGGGNGGCFTFAVGWKSSVTYVVYPTYNDAGAAATNALVLSKDLYSSEYGNKVGYSGWVTPFFCDVTQPGGHGAQGCAPYSSYSTGGGLAALGNSYSVFDGISQAISLYNQTLGDLGTAPASDAAYGRPTLTNGTSSYAPSAYTNYQKNSSGTLYLMHEGGFTDVSENVTTWLPQPTKNNFYFMSLDVTVTKPVQITTFSSWFDLPGPTSGCSAAGGEGSSYFREINATTWDYEYRDALYHNWVGITIGVYGRNTGGIRFSIYKNACRDFPAVELYAVNNTSPATYSPGQRFNAAVYLMPHFGNITNVAQIEAYRTESVAPAPEKQMYQKPVNLANATEPLTLEATQSSTQLIYVQSVTRAYQATMMESAGTRTQHFLWNATSDGGETVISVTGPGVNSWSQAQIRGTQVWNVTVSLTYSSSPLVVAFDTGQTTVTQLVRLTTNEGTSRVFTLTACSSSPPTVVGDGAYHDITMTPNCSFAIAGHMSGGLRWGFISGKSFLVDSPSFSTCSSGACPKIDLAYDTQFKLNVTGGNGISYSLTSETGDGWYKSGDSVSVSSNGTWARNAGTGQRVASWSIDGGSINPVAAISTVTAPHIFMNASHALSFDDATQYQLTLNPAGSSALGSCTNPTIRGDSYWYDSGTKGVSCTFDGVYGRSGGTGTRVASYNWDGGSNTTELTAGKFATTSVVMSSKHQVNLNAVVQYRLTMSISGEGAVTVNTNPTIPGDESWYDGTTLVSFTANPSKGANFSGWNGTGSGSYTGFSSIGTVTMSGPISELATFTGGGVTTSTNASSTRVGLGGIASITTTVLGVELIAGTLLVLLLAVILRRRGQRGKGESVPPPSGRLLHVK